MKSLGITDQQLEIIRHLYPMTNTKTLCRVFFNDRITPRQLKMKARSIGVSKKTRNAAITPINNGFQRGCQPWNAGTAKKKKGYRQIWLLPKDRFVRDGKMVFYIQETHYIWKQHYGHYPPKGSIILHKDGNLENNDINNLVLSNHAEHLQKNSIQNLPKPVQEVIYLRRSIIQKLEKRSSQNDKA